MTSRLTRNVMERANAQRRRLGRPMLSWDGFAAAIETFAFDHVDDVLVIALTDFVIPTDRMAVWSSAYEVPGEATGPIRGAGPTPALFDDPDQIGFACHGLVGRQDSE